MNPGPGSVSVIGMGYVGLCTSAVFASKGIRTVGIDIDEKRIAQIQQGQAHIGEAASILVITLLLKNGAMVIASDPLVIPNARKQLRENVEFTEDERSALNGADCCIVMTEWSQFEKLQTKDYLALMRTPNLVDARRLYNPKEYESLNFAAVGFGAQQQ